MYVETQGAEMTYTVQELALQYAEALTEYHELQTHVAAAGDAALRQDQSALRIARDEMYAAHAALNEACQHAAMQSYV